MGDFLTPLIFLHTCTETNALIGIGFSVFLFFELTFSTIVRNFRESVYGTEPF